ncbi:unnamed protein product [Adineta steineri]|uniref:Uncharacterized protein n=1 Tax=Adineta steineri TaxID=433720 RepID=A0A818V610_9BILA|nr:unnamed protein product [Adineta steineri]CAF0804203.1 unnamed protein product [Adineta steineri]CAF0881999.1 unnamed protein product [Adineta steineri]CAF3706511.1 unnamed protein product [Adineta steineri]CAF3735746.1 unnamed protein product [Adineta steineri]
MFFLISFLWLLPTSFLFFFAILSPNWITFTKLESNEVILVQRGIFSICYVLSSNSTYETKQCVPMIQQRTSTEPERWIYGLALGCASMAIICVIFSIIMLFLSGIYFQLRRHNEKKLRYLLFMCLLLFIIVGASLSVWALLISETYRLGITANHRRFNWPIWLAIVSTIGYLVSFITMFSSFLIIYRRNNNMEMHVHRLRDKF